MIPYSSSSLACRVLKRNKAYLRQIPFQVASLSRAGSLIQKTLDVISENSIILQHGLNVKVLEPSALAINGGSKKCYCQ